jgi:peptidoglycan glycosyltransferase
VNTPLRRLSGVIALLFASLLASSTWIQFLDADSLRAKPTNTRTLLSEFGRERGPILVSSQPIAESVPTKDNYKFQRVYRAGPEYSAVTGYYSVVYGAGGIEKAQGDLLSGSSDRLFIRRLGDLLTGREVKGAAVELTIRPKVQDAAWKALGDRRGAVVALDPKTGDILAMVSRPGFDPNALASHDSKAVRKAWQDLNADPANQLVNRAIAGNLYPPGSTFKLITSAAALSSGAYTPASQLPGPAMLKLPQTTVGLRNDDGEPCDGGTISLANALKISCNTAYAGLGLKLGPAALAAQAQKFGFDSSLHIPLTVSPSTFPANANPPQTAQSAIGQFEVRVTPLQMAMVSAAIANQGLLMKPNLIKDVLSSNLQVIDKPGPSVLGRAISPQVAADLTSMMEGVVTGGTGTRAQIDGVRVAGKTGTAQHGQQNGKFLPPHAWFTAFAPADDPKVAVAVVVEDGGGLGDAASGGRVAAPIAKAVIQAVIGS